MEETNFEVDDDPEAAPHEPAATNGTAASASSFYDPERPPFEERPVQSVQDRSPAVVAAMPAGDVDAHQASRDRKRMGAAAGAVLVVLLFLRRRRRRHGRA